MNLLDQPRDQVKDCIAWMRRVSETTPPSPQLWAEICEGLQEHALFLESFVVGKIKPVERHLFEGRDKLIANDHDEMPRLEIAAREQ